MKTGPILRLFEVKTKDGCLESLLHKFATTSAEVVANEPGNVGYFFGTLLNSNDDTVIFASVWDDTEAIRRRFGAEWQASFLPDGYQDLIESCSVRHFDMQSGWHV